MSWQHHLYSKLGSKKEGASQLMGPALAVLVERILGMSKVLYGLHMVSICANLWLCQPVVGLGSKTDHFGKPIKESI